MLVRRYDWGGSIHPGAAARRGAAHREGRRPRVISVQPSRQTDRAPVARDDRTFPWYIGAALAVAVGGGFLLALLVPLAAWLGWDWGVRWRALVQAHGHLQVAGWVGLFIAGMGFRLVPRFAGEPLRFPAVTLPALVLLAAGLTGRAVAQPWLDVPGMRLLLAAAALAELAGAALFAASVVATLRPVLGTFAPAPLLVLGAAGFVAQALLGLRWLLPLTADAPSIPANRDAALLSLQFFAFLLPFVLGVSLRALPVFFKRAAPSPRRLQLLAAALGLGAVLHAGAALLVEGAAGVRLQQAGALLIAAAVAAAIACTGVWRAPERLRPSARRAALLIQTAYLWLAVAAASMAVSAVPALVRGRAVPPYQVDAMRHVLALGVFSTLIMGMAQLVLPWLAMRRQRPSAIRIETWTLWALLVGATALRAAGALLEGEGAGAGRFGVMAAGGALGIVAVALFAVSVLRAARTPPPEIPVITRPA